MQRARASAPNTARRRLALAVAAASVAGLVAIGPAAAPVAAGMPVVERPWANGCITRTLSPGDRSDQVVCLERRLRSLGYPVAPDRHFDQGTAEVVRDMKRRGGFSGTANAGPDALDYIFGSRRQPVTTWAGRCIFSTLSPGMSTRQVTCLEVRLHRLGYETDRKPHFGPTTATALRHLQRRAGLQQTGVAGPQTLTYIFGAGRQRIQTWDRNCITGFLAIGMSGEPVKCLQRQLLRLNLLDSSDGNFGPRTQFAVRVIERRNGFLPDGIAGPNTLTKIFQARIPSPVRAGRDELGYALSAVSVAGHRAPLVPDSGNGRRIVYSRAQQRAWAIESDGHMVRSWLVSGSIYDNERRGTHHVYSKSRYAGAFTGAPLTLPYMIRYYKTPRNNHIGFHAIPVRRDGSRIMSVSQLGVARSSGCTRQSDQDAYFLWNWAPVGTKVVVV